MEETPSPEQHPNGVQTKIEEWGDAISNIRDNDVRFLFQNVNGISRSPSIHEEFKCNMIRLGAHLTAISESNVNWRNPSIRDRWESTLQRNYSDLHFSHSSCDEGFSPTSQRGGTSMICNSRMSSRLVSKGHDEVFGRWSWMKFTISSERQLLVITAYQVSQNSPNGLGSETYYMQQWRKIRILDYGGNQGKISGGILLISLPQRNLCRRWIL